MQPYGIAQDVLIEFHDSSTLVDFMVMDMDPCQQTSIILGKPFLKSVRVTIDKKRGIINMKVDRVHEKFIYHPTSRAAMPNLCFCIWWDPWVTYCIPMRPGHKTSTHYFSCLWEPGAVSLKNASGHVMLNLCFCIRWDLWTS
jgi:hypothetical protein